MTEDTHLEAEDPKFHLHHIIPFSRRKEGYNVDTDVNIKRLTKKLHKRWHSLFKNKTPQEQLELWLEVNGKVLDPLIREQISRMAYMPQNRFYRPEVVNNDRTYVKPSRGRPKGSKTRKKQPIILNID